MGLTLTLIVVVILIFATFIYLATCLDSLKESKQQLEDICNFHNKKLVKLQCDIQVLRNDVEGLNKGILHRPRRKKVVASKPRTKRVVRKR